ncbi:unnamed protein product [Hymenolepis diminuta]|uniref:N-acetylgalactosaminide beta-1,3-galactosyltransferase n=1 Tax=Hymenolepis diminuta TaxID=6216 RepID=A0A564YWC4_HYMDI|nr:unnamed protein product [Hymenolepis diminuta]
MRRYLVSKINVALMGFVIGMLCSLILTTTLNFYHPTLLIIEPSHSKHSGHHEGETILVDQLAKAMPVMAFIFTSKDGLTNRVSQVKSTWAKRFNEVVFFSYETNLPFHIVSLTPAKGWAYTRSAIAYIHENYGQNFAFFMKAQDNNYVIVENLRELLRTIDPEKPLLIGRQMKAKDGSTYMMEEAGYVISRAGLRKLAAAIKDDIGACRTSNSHTGQVIGKCAEAAGLELMHAVDENKLEFFHPFPPRDFFNKLVKEKYTNQTVYQPSQMNEIITSCSERSISFFNVQESCLYLLEYFSYHLYPYGIIRNPENYQEIWRLREHSTR